MGARLPPPVHYTGTVADWGLLSKIAKHNIRYPGQMASTQAKYYLVKKSIINARNKKYNADNKEKTAATRKTYREQHKKEIAASGKAYEIKNRERRAAYMKAYASTRKEQVAVPPRQPPPAHYTGTLAEWGLLSKWKKAEIRHPENKAIHACYKAKYCLLNRSILTEKKNIYRANNIEKISAKRKAYREEHKTQIAASNKAYESMNKEQRAVTTRKYNVKKAQIWWDKFGKK